MNQKSFLSPFVYVCVCVCVCVCVSVVYFCKSEWLGRYQTASWMHCSQCQLFREYWSQAFLLLAHMHPLGGGGLSPRWFSFISIETSCEFPQGHRQLPWWPWCWLEWRDLQPLDTLVDWVALYSLGPQNCLGADGCSGGDRPLSAPLQSTQSLLSCRVPWMAQPHILHVPWHQAWPSDLFALPSNPSLPCGTRLFPCHFQLHKLHLYWYLYDFALSTFLCLWAQVSKDLKHLKIKHSSGKEAWTWLSWEMTDMQSTFLIFLFTWKSELPGGTGSLDRIAYLWNWKRLQKMKKHFAKIATCMLRFLFIHNLPYFEESGHVGTYSFPNALRIKHTNSRKRISLKYRKGCVIWRQNFLETLSEM